VLIGIVIAYLFRPFMRHCAKWNFAQWRFK